MRNKDQEDHQREEVKKISEESNKKQLFQSSLEILEKEYPELFKLLSDNKKKKERIELPVDNEDDVENDYTDEEIEESVECYIANDNTTTFDNAEGADDFSDDSESKHSEESIYSDSMSSAEESESDEFSD